MHMLLIIEYLIKFLRLDHNRHKPLSFRIGAATSAIARVDQKMTLNVWVDWNLMLIVAISACKFLYFLRFITCIGSCLSSQVCFLFFCFSNSAVKMLVIYVCFSSRSVEGCWLKYVTFFLLFLLGVKLYSNKIPNQVSKRLLLDYDSLFICVFN